VKKVAAILVIVFAAGAIVAACSSSSNSSSGSGSSPAATAATSMAMSSTAAPMKASALPIPLSKLKSAKVAAGDPASGKMVFDANCASCHGAGARNQGGPGPTLAGTGIKAGQVAYMVLNPAAIDPSSGMPKLTLSNKQLADVAAYVASLK
jgi:mono/diheme cytochrome c family protein